MDIERGNKSTVDTSAYEDIENTNTQPSKVSVAVGQEHLASVVPPHESYEGYHRFDSTASWTSKEERRVVLKTDFLLLSWICFMVFHLKVSGAVGTDEQLVLRVTTRPRKPIQCPNRQPARRPGHEQQ